MSHGVRGISLTVKQAPISSADPPHASGLSLLTTALIPPYFRHHSGGSLSSLPPEAAPLGTHALCAGM